MATQQLGQGSWLALLAVVVGLLVRLVKSDRMGAALAAFGLPPIPKRALPWLALALGFVGAMVESKISGASWSAAALAGAWGVFSGAGAVLGNETLPPALASVAPGLSAFLFGKGAGAGTDAAATPPTPKPPPLPVLMLVLVLGLGATGCPGGATAIAPALADVVAIVTDAASIVEEIARFSDRYFGAHPQDPARAKVEDSISRARSTLRAALRTAKTGGDVAAAWSDFRSAYAELLSATAPIGVRSGEAASTTTLGAGAVLHVPTPLAIQ